MARRQPATLLPLLLLLLQLLPAPAAAQGAAERGTGELGGACRASGRCDVGHARCEGGLCVCPPSLVASANARRCLPVAESLGAPCDEDVQCSAVAHAMCQRRLRVCACRRGRVAVDARCLREVTLGAACQHSAQCTGLTECAEGRCVCTGIAFEAGGRCVTDDAGRDWEPSPPPAHDGSTTVFRFQIFVICLLVFALLRIR